MRWAISRYRGSAGAGCPASEGREFDRVDMIFFQGTGIKKPGQLPGRVGGVGGYLSYTCKPQPPGPMTVVVVVVVVTNDDTQYCNIRRSLGDGF